MIVPTPVPLSSRAHDAIRTIQAATGHADPTHVVERALDLYVKVLTTRTGGWTIHGPAVIQVWSQKAFLARTLAPLPVAVILFAAGMALGWVIR